MGKYKTLKEKLNKTKSIDERIKRSGVEGGLGDLFRAQDEMPDTETQSQYIGRNMVQDLIKPISEDKTEPKGLKEPKELFKDPKEATGSINDEKEIKDLFKEPKESKPIIDVYKALPASQEAKELEKQLKITQDTLNKLENPPITSQDARDKARADLNKVRQSRASTLEWAGLFERLVGSVAKYGAAKQGLDEGLDMSKVEIERTDWDKMIDRSFKKYEYELNQLTNQYGKEDKEKADVDAERTGMTKEIARLRERVAKARDVHARELARMRTERQVKKVKLSPAEEVISKKLGEDIGNFMSTERGKTLNKQANLKEALKIIQNPETNTMMSGLFGRKAANIVGSLLSTVGAEGTADSVRTGAEATRLINQTIQEDIGRVLDSQFAAREADQVLKRGFDPTATREDQIETVERMITVLNDYYVEKQALKEYMDANPQDPTGSGFLSPMADKYFNQVEKPKVNNNRAELERLRRKYGK